VVVGLVGLFVAACGPGEEDVDETVEAVAGPAPDYVVGSLGDPPATAATGTSMSISTTVSNLGTADAAVASTTRYFLSVDTVVGGDRTLAKQASVPALAIGASNTQTLALVVPAGLATGSYYLIACADRTNVIAELDNKNNCRTSTTTVLVGGPDLVVSALSDPPANAVVQTVFTVAESITNAGDFAAASTVTSYSLSADPLPGGDRRMSRRRIVPALAAGATSAGSPSLVIDYDVPAGTYYLIACADGRNTVAEPLESNNCRASAGTVTIGGPVCGDLVVSPPERCDDGNLVNGDGCDSNCIETGCPNGAVSPGEACDDGNLVNGDGCDDNCTLSVCGNGRTGVDEECDDGDIVEGNGCDTNCTFSACGNQIVSPYEGCDDGNLIDDDGCDANCQPTGCGNGQVTGDEVCDDANVYDGDGCDSNCTPTACGNGIQTGGEWCDDGNAQGGDGCEANCTTTGCGDGVVAGGEECDDGDAVDGDGCDTNCTLTACGNGIVTSGESCDDGDLEDDDTCDADCVPSSVVQIVAGYTHTCVRTRRGGVRCWGENEWGQLGYGNTESIGDDELPSTAGNVDIGGRAVFLASGAFHTCALLDTGAVRCWGVGSEDCRLGNGNDELIGDDEVAATALEVDIGGTVVQMGAGWTHTCVLLDTGAVRCWGSGMYGVLGHGNTQSIGDDETPAQAGDVDVGPGTVVQLTVGGFHNCVLFADGGIRCWGNAGSGQLGYANTTIVGDNELPSSVGYVLLGGPAAQLTTGYGHNCALMQDGEVRCWGQNGDGRLGYGTYSDVGNIYDPVYMGPVNVGAPVAEVTASAENTCALLTSGGMRCWGAAATLGYNDNQNIGDDETPASAGDVPVSAPVVQVSSAPYRSCVLLSGGVVECWGLWWLPYGDFYGGPVEVFHP
jgi:cysteine-rich repeat protein